ncbi:MAG: hypothetical protein IPL32_19010 [Chloracidobacterium sp.]|nr:hypothetical protein [Chloracidobacterium sp.]
MIHPESHVSNLILSQRLKELGVKQESLFWYVNLGKDEWHRRWEGEVFGLPGIEGLERVSAFFASELGEMMDAHSGKTNLLTRASLKGKWYCEISPSYIEQKTHCEYADTEADARAKMLIYLLENGLIKN